MINQQQQAPIQNSSIIFTLDEKLVQTPQILCSQGFKINRLCVNSNCSNSLICNEPDCKSCGVKKHPACPSVPLQGITELLNERIHHSRDIISKALEIDEDLIKAIRKSRNYFAKSYQIGSLAPEEQKIVSQIYKAKNPHALSGKGAERFCQKLKQQRTENMKHSQKILKHYKKSIAQVKQQIADIKGQLLDTMLQQFNKNYQHILKIDSNILKKEDPSSHEQIAFLQQALSYPKKLSLLYQGSENEFKAQLFHKKCDKIPNTLTIVKTQFGKNIAGFTKYCWDSNNSSVNQTDQQAFLLSLDLKQVMLPKDKNCLIWCKEGSGPIFGDGHDLCISDKCNDNRDSFANFPMTYNRTGLKGKYKNGQQSYKAFSGAANDINFRVIEYEVFKVNYEDDVQKCAECSTQ